MSAFRTVFGAAFGLALIWSGAFSASAKGKAYIINSRGDKVSGDSIQADSSGNLILKMGAVSQRFPRGRYRYAWIAKPREISQAEQLVRARRIDQALTALKAAFGKYKYMGWAGYTGFFRARILMSKKQYVAAEKVVKEALRYPNDEKSKAKLKQVLVETLLALNKLDDADRIVRGLKTSDPKVACFVFNTRGKLLAAQGKKKEALLQYLKTVLIFDKSVGPVRKEAYREVVNLLKEMKDQRAKTFEAKMRKEYP